MQSQIPVEQLRLAVTIHASSAFIDKVDCASASKRVSGSAALQRGSILKATSGFRMLLKQHNLMKHWSSHRAFPTFFYIVETPLSHISGDVLKFKIFIQLSEAC